MNAPEHPPLATRRWLWRGIVQGVGFRPAVVRLARASGLSGWVRNTPEGVEAVLNGPAPLLAAGPWAWAPRLPKASQIDACEDHAWSAPAPDDQPFGLRESLRTPGERPTSLAPDLALCPACRAEIADPSSRRHRYAFTSCAECGPRFTILEGLPFDRDNTTLRDFPLCPSCQREYTDPADRRFHAQAMACPACGPRLAYHDRPGSAASLHGDEALHAAAARLRAGEIGAILGLGGFHLMVRADNEAAVARLRARKRRPVKPLAVLVADLTAARAIAHVDDHEAAQLSSPAAPIVLLRPRRGSTLATGVAPAAPTIGVMLAATPLHVLLAEAVGVPLVATSGNLSEEPLCTTLDELRARLPDVPDFVLAHDRRIARPLDDSVLRVIDGTPVLARRARGFVPAALNLRLPTDEPLFAAGAHLKASFALAAHGRVLPGPHIGDLDDPRTQDAWSASLRDHLKLFRGSSAPFAVVAHDLHPDYASNHLAYAALPTTPLTPVAHHHAHAAAVAAEHGLDHTLALVWDGTGLGPDGTLWGGEFLELLPDARCRRLGRLRPFPLPGGEAAIREPARCAVGALLAAGLAAQLENAATAERLGIAAARLPALITLASRAALSPACTGAGRLFDALAALLGLATAQAHEAQAALAFEAAADAAPVDFSPSPLDPATLVRTAGDLHELDWAPLLEPLLAANDVPLAAAQTHRLLGQAAALLLARAAPAEAPRTVVLAGGCLLNARLADELLRALRAAGFVPLLPRECPPGDAGLAIGQLVLAASL